MNKQSLTITGIIVVLLAFILDKTGVGYDMSQLQNAIEGIAYLAGLVMAFYGRYRHGDINPLGRKTKSI